MSQKVKALGIDLGTTNSVVACVTLDGRTEVLPNAEGDRLTPSVFAIWETGERVVGRLAAEGEKWNPQSTIRSVKRRMGTNFRYHIDEQPLSPEQISSEILKKLKRDAESYLGHEVSQAVITVPAYFDSDARQCTKTAGELAGFEVLRVINEPTAAALAYGLDKKAKETVLVYDLGGGTFDVTILSLSGDGLFDVKSTNGDVQLGGDDFDTAIMEYCQTCWDEPVDDPEGLAALRASAEAAKKSLTGVEKTKVSVPGRPPVDVTRAKFEELITPILERTKTCVEAALRDAGYKASQIDEVVFVGGSTRVPLVSQLVEQWTGKRPNKSVNVDEAVAVGAAKQAAILSGQTKSDVLLIDVIPLTLGVEAASGVMDRMIDRNTTIPTEASKLFTTTEDSQTTVAIRVYQGERLKAAANKLLGQFMLEGIPDRPKGVPEVEVTFAVDANGILSVKAEELSTKLMAKVTLTGSSSLTADEVAKMMEEATANKVEDERYFATAAAQDRLLGRVQQIEQLKRDVWHILTEDTKAEVDDVFVSLTDAQGSQNIKLLDELETACQETMVKVNKEMALFAAKILK
ncbi:MAG: Hsp70 family protein [Armatimonadetes bacterium]|nr:Hsp70 family protein [Armatimonadota bacterium]